MKLASLPMYDLPELRASTDAWWQGLADAFRRQGLEDVPETLERGERPDGPGCRKRLIFGQCCGYDLIRHPESLTLVAAPAYRSPHCRGANYRSLIVVAESNPAARFEDLRGKRCAINSPCSHSGHTALRHLIASLGARPARGEDSFFTRVEASGSHADSLSWVREGRADCTSVDCVTFALLTRHRTQAVQGLRVLAETAPAPGLPYVTGAGGGEERLARLRDGLREALEDPDLAAARDALLIDGIEVLPLAAYDRIAAMETEADAGAPPLIRS
ncbi:MAG: PhnD/SsuA/transferrin family substrate-binding protein [Kiloniellales bacterium]|nr:PhnD/SsuA/transferrin family substrate-binding protein [Kiloniellales bacterium]